MRQGEFGRVVRHREARALLVAAGVSDLGDQVARVALSVLVFERTGSVLLTAAVYAVAYGPWLLGGPALATLADRLPRRQVLVGSDAVRAATVALMTVPGLPVWALLVLLFLTELAAPPFQAARSALLPDVLDGDDYVAGSALLNSVQQACLFGGVAAGGALLLVATPTTALALDAVSFALSALLLHRGLRARPAAAPDEVESLGAGTRAGLRAVFSDAVVRRLVLGSWIACAVAVLPEGLVLAYTHEMGAPPYAVGVLLAAEPAGGVVAGLLVARLVGPERRTRLLWPLLVVPSLPLVAMVAQPGLAVTAAVLFLTGASGAGLLIASTDVGRSVAADVRGRVFGIAASGLMAAQGVALLAGGLLAGVLPVHQVMAAAGVVGVVGVLPLAVAARVAPVRVAPAPATVPIPLPRTESAGAAEPQAVAGVPLPV